MEAKKVVIFGAGLSGCTIARLHAEQNHIVQIFEINSKIGGNCYDYKEKNGIYVHKFGPHIFHTSYEDVWEFVTQFADFNDFKNEVEININSKLISFPINFKSIEQLFGNTSKKIIDKLKQMFPNRENITIYELINCNDSIIKDFSYYIYENIYQNYTTKMWGINPNEIDKTVLERVKINLNYSNNYFPNDRYQGIPINGYSEMMKKMINHKNIEINLNFDFKNRIYLKNNFVFMDKKKLNADWIYYCGSIDELFKYKFGKLPYRSLNIVFEKINKKSFQKTPIVNYPSHPSMTRICEYKYFTNIKDNSYTIISKEFPGNWDKNSNIFKDRYYPINNRINESTYLKYLKLAQLHKIIPLGRLANYKYFDMDDAIKNAIEIFKKLD